MKIEEIEEIDVDAAIESLKQSLKKEGGLSPAFRSSLELLLVFVELLLDRVTLNSSASSIPPSADPSRKKTQRDKRKPGGQKGHEGTTYEPLENHDRIVPIEIDKQQWVKSLLTESALMQADETTINNNCTRYWLHCASILSYTH